MIITHALDEDGEIVNSYSTQDRVMERLCKSIQAPNIYGSLMVDAGVLGAIIQCPECEGSGKSVLRACLNCDGDGTLLDEIVKLDLMPQNCEPSDG